MAYDSVKNEKKLMYSKALWSLLWLSTWLVWERAKTLIRYTPKGDSEGVSRDNLHGGRPTINVGCEVQCA